MKAVIVFSGYNPRAVIAFVRSLTRLQVPYTVVARSQEDEILATQYRDKVGAIRDSDDLDWEVVSDILGRVKSQFPASKALVAPSTEALNRLLLANRDSLEKMGIVLPLCEESLYLRISEKQSFTEMCLLYGIDVPTSFPSLDSAPLPIVAKPKFYRGKTSGIYLKPALLFSNSEKTSFRFKFDEEDFFFQEYVTGHSYYFLFHFFKDGRPPLMFSQENLIQQADGGSILAARASDIHRTASVTPYVDLLIAEGFHGLIMIEVKGTSDRLKMIEANPRFWGPSQLFLDANVDLFQAMLADYGFDVPHVDKSIGEADSNPLNTSYFWDDGQSFNDEAATKPTFHEYDEQQFRRDFFSWNRANLYNRPDSAKLYRQYLANSKLIDEESLERLKTIYNTTSKHSAYQVLPPILANLISPEELITKTRHEKARFDFIEASVRLEGRRVLDIGGNVGYFTFEALGKGAMVDVYEGNKVHGEFVSIAADMLHAGNRLSVFNDYYLFNDTETGFYDVVFLLNVLHHVGDDFGDAKITKDEALILILRWLKTIAEKTDVLVFQIGFNWKGDRRCPLFASGSKEELIAFIRENLDTYYEFVRIGVAEVQDFRVVYTNVNDENIGRRDDLGEFLNRPLFIMRSKLKDRP